jgi:hypothetical protein
VGNPHAGFDEAGAGNGPLSTAPAFDPTCEGLGVKFPRATRLTAFLTAKKPLIISDIKGLDNTTDNSIRNGDLNLNRIFSKQH